MSVDDEEATEEPGAEEPGAESEDAEAPDSGQPDDGGEGMDPEELAKRRKLKLMIIAAGVVVVLLATGGALVFTGAMGSFVAWLKGGPSTATVSLPGPPVLHEFPEILVDLKTGRCRATFIKLRVVAEVPETDIPRIDGVTTQILDGFQTHLRQYERADLVGKEGTDKLRAAFRDIINKAAAPAQAYNILFREFILQ